MAPPARREAAYAERLRVNTNTNIRSCTDRIWQSYDVGAYTQTSRDTQ